MIALIGVFDVLLVERRLRCEAEPLEVMLDLQRRNPGALIVRRKALRAVLRIVIAQLRQIVRGHQIDLFCEIGQQNRGRIAGRILKRQPPCGDVFFSEIGAFIICDVAINTLTAQRNPRVQLARHDGGVADEFGQELVIGAELQPDRAFQLVRWAVWHDIDRTTRGCAPEERVLRTFENLDLLDIQIGRA